MVKAEQERLIRMQQMRKERGHGRGPGFGPGGPGGPGAPGNPEPGPANPPAKAE